MSNMFRMKCPACSKELECPDELRGTMIPCPICEQNIVAERISFDWGKLWRWVKNGLLSALAALVVFLVVWGLALMFKQTSASNIEALILVPCALIVYFIPAIVGRKKRNSSAITLLNLFLGWTFIGWVVALVWAATVDTDKR